MSNGSFLLSYGRVSQVSLASLEMIVVLLELRMMPSDRLAMKANILQQLHVLKNEFEKAEQHQTEDLQELATAILEETHNFADFLEGVIKVVPTDWVNDHRKVPSRIRKSALQTLQINEEEGLADITKVFAPLHKKVTSLILRTELVL